MLFSDPIFARQDQTVRADNLCFQSSLTVEAHESYQLKAPLDWKVPSAVCVMKIPYEKEKPKTDTQKCWISQRFQWKVIKEKGDGKGNGKQQK